MPGAQSLGEVAPVEQNAPAAQSVHSDCEPRLVVSPNVPAWQGIAAVAPAWQYAPTSHASHAVLPSLAWKRPGLHLTQLGKPVILV